MAPASVSSPASEASEPRSDAPRAELVELPVPGFGSALVVLPATREPRPLLVGAHGAGDSPEWQCETWRRMVRDMVVLCPRGVPFSSRPDPGYFFRNHHELEAEVLAAVAALREAHGSRVAPGPGIYTGYSQGATMGALMVVRHGDLFDRLVLVEGGYSEWNVPIAKRYAASGGKRVLVACGTEHCRRRAEASVTHLIRGGVQARLEYAAGAGHIYGGAVAEQVVAAWPWLLAESRDPP